MLLRISLIIAILAGIGTIVFTQLKTREQIQGIITERENHKKQEQANLTRATKAEKDLAATKDLLTQTKDTLAKTEEELNGTKQQLATATEQLNKTKSDLAKAAEERKTIQAEIAKWESLGVKPEAIRGMMADLKKQQDAIAALEDEKKILDRRVRELKNQIALLIGDPEYQVELPEGTKGNVVAVDPKWNFVVLDLGADKGMLQGGVLMVHRNSKLVGKVRIREVFPNRSVANMVPGWRLGEIEEGDQVLY
jgi:archaellum component FlaC